MVQFSKRPYNGVVKLELHSSHKKDFKMGTAHYFVTNDVAAFRRRLETKHYSRERVHGWEVRSKVFAQAVVKHYGFWPKSPAKIRVTYELLKDGKPLLRLTNRLKKLNWAYLKELPVWITKRAPRAKVRERKWKALQAFLHKYRDLIDCFRYAPDESLIEGNHSYNMEIAATANELTFCIQFIKGLLAAYTPFGLVRGRRHVDKPAKQRNGWIKRFAETYKKRGWLTRDITREIQKELREGTWNERLRLQYNLAGNTICKIAGIKPKNGSIN
jgi:hypothetical protein